MDSEKEPLMKEISCETPTYSAALLKQEYPQPTQCLHSQCCPAANRLDPNSNLKTTGKKKSPFLERDLEVKNPGDVDVRILLEGLVKRFSNGYWKWRRRATVFKFANLFVTIILILLQVAQVAVFQVASLDYKIKTTVATILPAVTGAVLAIQQKLKWSEKAVKSKKSAALCKKLRSHAEYRLDLMEAGAVLDDTVKLWNASLRVESTELPAFLMAY